MRTLRNLVVTIILSFPSLINVGGLLALCVFMFGVLGVQLFTFVVTQNNLTAQRNFHSLGSAMILLFQCLTGDNWSGLMSDAAVQEDSGLCSYEVSLINRRRTHSS